MERRLIETHIPIIENGMLYAVLVFEYVEYDLQSYLSTVLGNGEPVPNSFVENTMYQILLGLDYLHWSGGIHRNLKPESLRIDRSGKQVKIADFDLAIDCAEMTEWSSTKVADLGYRAPELLLGTTVYGQAVDIWSVGCIFAEIITGKAMFQADSELQQILNIFEMFGTPSKTTWPGVEKLPNWHTYPNFEGSGIEDRVIKELGVSEEALKLLSKMLTLNPKRRCTVKEALEHPYFDHVRFLYKYPVSTVFKAIEDGEEFDNSNRMQTLCQKEGPGKENKPGNLNVPQKRSNRRKYRRNKREQKITFLAFLEDPRQVVHKN